MTDKKDIGVFAEDADELSSLTVIQNKYTFWFRGGDPAKSQKTVNYNESIKRIANFQTVEGFWRIYDHMKRPSDFRVATEFHLFKFGIHPTWEDEQNKLGGKWTIRLKKGIGSRYWEDILLAIIGEQFDVGPEICGAVLSVRTSEDILSVWNKTADNLEAINKIRDQIRRILRLPSIIAIEYKRHQDSLVDKSSYRNPTMVWRAPTKNQQNYYHDKLENGAKVGGYRNNENNRGQYNQGNNYASNNYNQNGHTEKQQQSGENNNRPGWKPRGDGDGASRPEFQKRDHQYQNQHNGGSHSGQRQDNNSWNSNNKYQNNPGWQRSGGSYQKSNQPAVTASNRLPPPTSAASVTNNQASGDVWTRVRTSSKND